MTATQSARRYAKAIFETAPNTASVRTDLDAIRSALLQNPSLLEALTHPAVSAEKKKAIARDVFATASAPLPRLFEMLIDSGKAGLLPEIATQYKTTWNKANNVHPARVTSSAPLDDAAAIAVKQSLERALGGTVELTTHIDPSIIGGIKVDVDGTIYDGSVKARLQALRRSLLGTA